jgi:hypothetical protein
MADKMACTHSKALSILADSGLLNETNAQEVFDKLCANVKQPTAGYFYINDVYDFAVNELALLVEWADKQERRAA